MSAKPLEFLVVDDDPSHSELLRRAFESFSLSHNIHIVRDGIEALSFLKNESPYEESPRPDVVILDLNMPRKNGLEALAEIKADRALKRLPVVILTCSEEDEDMISALDKKAAFFLNKPKGWDGYLRLAKALEDFAQGG